MNSTELLTKMATLNEGMCRTAAIAKRERPAVEQSRFWNAVKMSLFSVLSDDLKIVDPAIGAIVAHCFEDWVDWESVFNSMVEAGEASLAVRPAEESELQ